MTYYGSCHCGLIRFHAEGDIQELVRCSCSHCHKKGYLLWFVPRDALTLSTSKSDLSSYTFNKHVIQHHFCPQCGCAPFGFGYDGQGNGIAAINARCLDQLELSPFPVVMRDNFTA